MALFNIDLRDELAQTRGALQSFLSSDLQPAITQTINQASIEMQQVVRTASQSLDGHIRTISQELHQQRSLTKDDIDALLRKASFYGLGLLFVGALLALGLMLLYKYVI